MQNLANFNMEYRNIKKIPVWIQFYETHCSSKKYFFDTYIITVELKSMLDWKYFN